LSINCYHQFNSQNIIYKSCPIIFELMPSIINENKANLMISFAVFVAFTSYHRFLFYISQFCNILQPKPLVPLTFPTAASKVFPANIVSVTFSRGGKEENAMGRRVLQLQKCIRRKVIDTQWRSISARNALSLQSEDVFELSPRYFGFFRGRGFCDSGKFV